jgi:Na+-transporting NADH:ubiquinone oxidoreductase subunit C
MSNNNESIGKTFGVVISLCLVCAIFVATAAVVLRPKQVENKLVDAQKNILVATNLLKGDDVKTLFNHHVKERLVDLETGEFVDQDPTKYDYRKAMKDSALSVALSPEEDKASVKRVAKVAPVYFAYNEGVESGKLSAIVLPVHGYGLWSTMHAFVALDVDGVTIKGVNFYEHAETPGLGGEVQNPKWVGQFVGKKLTDEAGVPTIKVLKPGNAKSESMTDVDGLSGATLTSNGVQNTFEFWSGAKGFAPFLTKVRQGALNNG